MDFLDQIDPNLVDNVGDFLSPIISFWKGIRVANNLKKWAYYIQIIVALFLAISYGRKFLTGVRFLDKTNDTMWYMILNIVKVVIFMYLLWLLNQNENKIENFDFYITGDRPVNTPIIEPNPYLNITIATSPGQILPGQRIQYDLTLTNTGNVDALNVKLVNRVPCYTSFVSSPRGVYRDGYVTWSNINLAPQEYFMGTYIVKVHDDLDTFDVPQIINDEYLAYSA